MERSPWEHRLGRTLRVFLLLLAASGMYRLAVVPLVEPRLSANGTALEPTAEEAAAMRARAESRMDAIGAMFPAGSWERDSPVVLESRDVRLLFKQYHSLPDGRVNLVPCTLVLLPEKNDGGGRTIVMRSPQGAVLEFAEPLDLRQGRLSKLIGGSLRGQISVRGGETAPGAEDDLEIVSRDLQLRGLELRSTEAVQFRYGRSTGRGQGLLITLLPKPNQSGRGGRRRETTGGGPDLGGPNVGGIDAVRLERDVRLELEGIDGDMLPGPETTAASAPGAAGGGVRVACAGPMTFHPAAGLVLLEDRVEVVRAGRGAAGEAAAADELTCDTLTLALGGAADAAAREEGAGSAGDGRAAGGRLAVREIEARGAPAVARSGSAGLEARAARIGYQIASRRILLDGGQRVSLSARGIEMEASAIDYVPDPPVDGEPPGPGTLLAAGPGWIRTGGAAAAGRPGDDDAPAAVVGVRFNDWLRARPEGDGYVTSVTGDADVSVEGQGTLNAAEMHLWMEADATAASRPDAAPSPDAPGLAGLRPARMLARGQVVMDSRQIAARTGRLELWFRHEAPDTVAGGSTVSTSESPLPPAGPGPAAAPALPGRSPDSEAAGRSRFLVSSSLVRGLVVIEDRKQELDEMSLEGQVELVEETAGPDAGQPIAIRGDQMQVTRPMRPDARAVVSGSPARVAGRALDLEGPLVTFDRGRNHVEVDGAGRLTLPVPEGGGLDQIGIASMPRPTAPPAAAAGADRLVVDWSGRMEFDGLTARFVDRVVASGGAATVRAASIDVVFDRLLDFAAGASRQQQPQVARVLCGGGVRIDTSTRSQRGEQSVERLAIRDLSVDRVSGDVVGNGPGRLSSVRLGPPPGALSESLPGQAGDRSQAPPSAHADELSFLGIDFQRGLRGNLHRRLMEFHQRVEAIWGPVADWNGSLDLHAPGGLPPRAVAITSEMLSVAQGQPLPPAAGRVPGDPAAGRIDQRTSLELAAAGNVLVEGETFTARSARLSWSEAQDLLVFEGDGRADAQLFRQTTVGGPTSSASAGRILYWRSLNRIDVNDARYLDLDQLNAGSAAMRMPALPPAGAGRSAASGGGPPGPPR